MRDDRPVYSADEAVAKLCNRHFLFTGFLAFLRFAIAWSFAFGAIVLIFRILFPGISLGRYNLIGFAVALVYCMNFSFMHRLPKEKALAIIDSANAAGGLLLAGYETGDKTWEQEQKTQFRVPDVKAKLSTKLTTLLVAVIFLVTCFYVPVFKLEVNQRMDLHKKAVELNNQVSLLESEGIITSKEQKEFKNTIEDIVEASDKEAPGITFEALDQLSYRIKQMAGNSLQRQISNTELLRKIEKVSKTASAANKANSSNSSQSQSFNAEQLRDLLRKAGVDENKINEFLRENFGISSGENGSLSSEMLASASSDVGSQIQQQTRSIADVARQLADSKLLEPAAYEKIQQKLEQQMAGSENSNGDEGCEEHFSVGENKPSSGISEQCGNNSMSNPGGSKPDSKTMPSCNNAPGAENGEHGDVGGSEVTGMGIIQENGGVGKGGNSSPSLFGNKVSDYNAEFKDHELPDVNAESAVESINAGVGVSAPLQIEDKDITSQTSINWKSGNGESKRNNTSVLPKYRNAVKKYFE